MPFFTYTARDTSGKKISGKVEAQAKETAASILRSKGLFIISLHDVNASFLTELQALTDKIKSDDIVNFTRQLATMVEAGLPLIQALTILTNQARPALQKVLQSVIRSIEGGENFGKALSKHDKVFDSIYVALVQAGEAAGALDTILLRMADTLEKQKEFKSKTKGALIYPGIVLTALAGVMTIMMIFVVPQMTSLYADFGADLPVMTQILIDVSNFFRNQWYVLLAAIVGTITVVRAWKKTAGGRYKYDQIMLKIPLMGKLRQQIMMSEFSRTLSLMVAAGISLLEALNISQRGIDNVVYQQAVQRVRTDVEKGQSLSRSMEKQGVFPPLLYQMASVGEETGQLDGVLEKVAKYYESESEHAIKGLTTALEPMIMVVLGVGVGFLIMAIVMPIYNLTSQF